MAALTVANIKSASIGGAMRMLTGDFTCTTGDAATTITVAAGKIYGFQFIDNLTSGPINVKVQVSYSVSSGIMTITAYTQETVTDGTFHFVLA